VRSNYSPVLTERSFALALALAAASSLFLKNVIEALAIARKAAKVMMQTIATKTQPTAHSEI
jgi:hypothetical protein